MVLIGNAITPNDVVADPRYSHLEPEDVTRQLLSQYTMEQKAKNDIEATKMINGIKQERGNGVSALVRIYNASGDTLTFEKQGPNWHGHMFKYPPDNQILNGQWSVFLYVHTSGAATGAQSCVIYTIDNVGEDIFMGWMVPWNQSAWSSTVYTEVNKRNQWPSVENWDSMKSKINHSSSSCKNSYNGSCSDATCGDVTSPIVNFIEYYTDPK